MTVLELDQSARKDPQAPSGISLKAKALWFARAGRWHEAHELCSEIHDAEGAWIHAWLHRQEGDLGNAAYWYRLANQPIPKADLSLDQEWSDIAAKMIGS